MKFGAVGVPNFMVSPGWLDFFGSHLKGGVSKGRGWNPGEPLRIPALGRLGVSRNREDEGGITTHHPPP